MSILRYKDIRHLGRRAIAHGLAVLIILLLLIISGGRNPCAEMLYGPEYQVKAGFIYNFAKFVDWPQGTFNSKEDPLSLCVISSDPRSDIFFSLRRKRVGGRRLIVRRYEKIEDCELNQCHIIFLDSTDRKFIQECMECIGKRNILTIGHTKGFVEDGGIINFFMDEERLRFEVNLDAAEQAGLKLGSQILMSAEIVKKKNWQTKEKW